MQKSKDDPIWDLVIAVTAGIGTIVWLFWASMMFNSRIMILWDNRISSLVCIIMAFCMLSTAMSYWYQWKRRR